MHTVFSLEQKEYNMGHSHHRTAPKGGFIIAPITEMSRGFEGKIAKNFKYLVFVYPRATSRIIISKNPAITPRVPEWPP